MVLGVNWAKTEIGLFGVDGPCLTCLPLDDDSSDSFVSFNNSENEPFGPVKAENPEAPALNASNPPVGGDLVGVVDVAVVGAKADLATPSFDGTPNAGSLANCGLVRPGWEGAPKPLGVVGVVVERGGLRAPPVVRSPNAVTAGVLASSFLKNGDDSCRDPSTPSPVDDCWRKPGAGALGAGSAFFRSKDKPGPEGSGDDGGDTIPEGGSRI